MSLTNVFLVLLLHLIDAFSPQDAARSHLPHKLQRTGFVISSRSHVLHKPRPTQTHAITYTAASSSFLPNANDFAAGGTLVLASMIGILFEKLNFRGGHVVTLLSAAFLSNISRVVPSDHMLYNLCWSIFLPASLVLALLSTSSLSPASPALKTPKNSRGTNNRSLNSSIMGMALPFAAGSLGSILGCCASFFCIKFDDVKATAILAGSLCASYIGGTVNFFAAAKILMSMFNCNNASGREGIGSLFSSLAAADLVVMAIYFSLLSFASKSALFHRLFPSRDEDDTSNMKPTIVSATSESRIRESSSVGLKRNASVGTTIIAGMWASFISISSVLAATDLEKRVNKVSNLPGTMCAFLAIFGMAAERLIGLGVNRMNKGSSSKNSFRFRSLERVPLVAPILSNMCFYLLFAAIGTTADINAAVASGPKALAFASLALVIHFITVVVCTYAGGMLSRRSKKYRLPRSTLQEMLTASNAAIGGPSTAAAFAADLVPITPSTDLDRRSMILGATVWGVFGYAIGTATGVALTKALMRRI